MSPPSSSATSASWLVPLTYPNVARATIAFAGRSPPMANVAFAMATKVAREG